MKKELTGAKLFAHNLEAKDYDMFIKWANGEIKEYQKLIDIITKLKNKK
jgi:hypothetical protein